MILASVSHIYLASQSPRRRELLAQIGVDYELVSVDVEESRQPDESPETYVQRLSRDKAQAGARVKSDLPVLGADTIVVLENQVLEKPADKLDGINMLMALSDTTHQVMTAVSLTFQGCTETALSTTVVSFRNISRQEAEAYWATGEPADKAGAYGIQGLASVFVREIKGSYSGVVGLPLFETSQLLRNL